MDVRRVYNKFYLCFIKEVIEHFVTGRIHFMALTLITFLANNDCCKICKTESNKTIQDLI